MSNVIEARLSALLTTLEPAERRTLAKDFARRLRESQAKRIAAQQNTDGSAYEPRKPRLRKKKGAVRRAMFAKLRTAKYLKVEATSDSAAVAFADSAQRIARVHQYGLRDKVGRFSVKYPVRELLGFTDAEVELVQSLVMDHLSHQAP